MVDQHFGVPISVQEAHSVVLYIIGRQCHLVIGTVLGISVILWLVLAVSVGLHAKGHNRSGIVWFCIVAVTGIFGVAFYLLAITSRSQTERNDENDIDQAIIHYVPRLLIPATIGAFGTFAISAGYFSILTSLVGQPTVQGHPANTLQSVGELVVLLSTVVGIFGGPYVLYRFGWRKFTFVSSHVVILLTGGVLVNRILLQVLGLEGVLSSSGLALLVSAILLAALGIALIAVWTRIYKSYVQDRLKATLRDPGGQVPINMTRRRTLGIVGGAGLAGSGVFTYSATRPTIEDIRITEIRSEYESGDPVVHLSVFNPTPERVRVEIDVWIEDTYTNDFGDTYVNSVYKDVLETLPPESETEVTARFGDEKTDFGRNNPGIGAEFEVDERSTGVEVQE